MAFALELEYSAVSHCPELVALERSAVAWGCFGWVALERLAALRVYFGGLIQGYFGAVGCFVAAAGCAAARIFADRDQGDSCSHRAIDPSHPKSVALPAPPLHCASVPVCDCETAD